MYDITSSCADDFINHEEILDTLAYADQNKENSTLIDSIIQKAKKRKGLSHREASVLLACPIPEKNEEIFRLAEQIKKDFYGNRIVMFAPLYLSNYCINGCTYCPYHAKNKHIARKQLSQEEIRKEVIALQDMGHKRLALEAGEDPVRNTMDYYLECIRTIYSIHHRNGAIRRVNINIAATTVDHYRLLKEAGIGTYILFQETYHKESYLSLHPTGPKHDYNYHTEAMDRAMQVELMMSASEFCSGLTNIAMNLPDCSCMQNILKPHSESARIPSAFHGSDMPMILILTSLTMELMMIPLPRSLPASVLQFLYRNDHFHPGESAVKRTCSSSWYFSDQRRITYQRRWLLRT